MMDSLEPSAKQHEQLALSVVETLSSVSKIIPNQEYLLQGSILDGAVDVLLHRLRGLCDNVDAGPETFHDHEACFVLYGSLVPGQQQMPPLTLRVRRAVDDTAAPWHLRYMGQPELGNRATMVRSILDVACGSDILEFLKELGCRREFDFITKGFIFRKGKLKIIVGKVFRYESGKAVHELEAVTGSHYVEMSAVAPTGQDTVGEDIKTLSEQLRPLIHLDKVETRRHP